MNIQQIAWPALAAAYLLMIVPFAILLWHRVGLAGQLAAALVRMTLQLLFVGFYLQFVFEWNNVWLTGAWLAVMIVVADGAILRGCRLRLRPLAAPLFVALAVGTIVPLGWFLWAILQRPHPLDAQYAIPIGGMILGNCLRADIVGIRAFYEGVRKQEGAYLEALAQGARLGEATLPFLREACYSALAPTVGTMATIGLVSLPGMMTGVILGGNDPMTAIRYQIVIMIAIVTGTAITVWLAIVLTMRVSFDGYGVLRREILRKG